MADTPIAQTKIVVPGAHSMVSILGSRDELLRLIERTFASDIHVRGNEITISGDPEETALVARLFEELVTLLERGDVLTADAVERSVAMLRARTAERPADVLTLNILSSRGRTIRPKTLNQKRYVDAIDEHTVVFGIGPAGTGKTYLAMAKAVQALQAKQVNRIILTRPAVEAGERLGFLPGTLYEKIDPYLRPLYDALHDMVDPDSIPRLMASGTIEVAPLAYMRGRTLNDAFIILDEAQNTSPEQMKMFLTRLGFGSKMVVTGDVTQIDLPTGTSPGCGSCRRSSTASRTSTSAAHQSRRRPPPAGQRHRRRLRPLRRPAATRRPAGCRRSARRPRRPLTRAATVTIDIPNESGVDVDARALERLARHVLAEMGVHPLVELSVRSGRRGSDDGAARAVHGRAGADRRARVPDGRADTTRATTRTRTRRRRCSATSCSAPRSRAGRPGRRGTPPRTSCTCSARTACCTCSATTTATPTRSVRCSRCRRSCSRRYRQAAP